MRQLSFFETEETFDPIFALAETLHGWERERAMEHKWSRDLAKVLKEIKAPYGFSGFSLCRRGEPNCIHSADFYSNRIVFTWGDEKGEQQEATISYERFAEAVRML